MPKQRPHPEIEGDTEHLFVVEFQPVPNFQVSQAAYAAFEKGLQGYIWVLDQSGFITSVKSKVKRLYYTILLDDPCTLASFEKLSRMYKGQGVFVHVPRWELKVYENYTPEQYDRLRIDQNGRFYIQEYHEAWTRMQESWDKLASAVASVERKLA